MFDEEWLWARKSIVTTLSFAAFSMKMAYLRRGPYAPPGSLKEAALLFGPSPGYRSGAHCLGRDFGSEGRNFGVGPISDQHFRRRMQPDARCASRGSASGMSRIIRWGCIDEIASYWLMKYIPASHRLSGSRVVSAFGPHPERFSGQRQPGPDTASCQQPWSLRGE